MISIATSSLRGVAASPARSALARNLPGNERRRLSMACANSVLKLNGILEEYRAKNYSQELPRRFRNDVIKAASVSANPSRQSSDSSIVCAEGINRVLRNIGMGHRISREEIDAIMSEVGTCPIGSYVGEKECVISVDQMLDLMSRNWEEHHHGLNQPRP